MISVSFHKGEVLIFFKSYADSLRLIYGLASTIRAISVTSTMIGKTKTSDPVQQKNKKCVSIVQNGQKYAMKNKIILYFNVELHFQKLMSVYFLLSPWLSNPYYRTE